MKARLISLWIWLEIALVVLVSTVLMTLLFLLTAPFDRLRRVVGRFFRLCGTMIVRLNPLWSLKRSGGSLPKEGGPYVVISNHQSLGDIPVISFLPWEMKWLSKEANFRVPGLGWMMRMAGDIPLRRGEKESAQTAMTKCRWYLDQGMNVMIFPEGTRSSDGEIAPFKDGAFRLAIETGRPILPVVVAGTRYAIPKDSLLFEGGKCKIRMEVLPPVGVEGMTMEDLPKLREKIRSEMAVVYERLGKAAPMWPPEA